MKLKLSAIEIAIMMGSALIMACVAVVVAFYAVIFPMPPWQRHQLPAPPGKIAQILHVEFRPHAFSIPDTPEPDHADPAGDTVFVSTTDGAVYSYTLFDDQWQRVTAPEAWNATPATQCAPKWDNPEPDARILEPLPLEKSVRASSGIRVGHTMVDAVRCYVLYDDGGLEVWGRELSGDVVFVFVYLTPVIAAVGLVIGLLIGALIAFIRHRVRARAAPPPSAAA